MVLEDFIPKGKFFSEIVTSLERITQPATDFIRGNPIISTAALGIGTTGLFAGIAAVGRRAAKKKAKRKAVRKRVTRRKPKKAVKRRKRVTHRSPRHKGHKRVSFTTADGKRVSFLVRGAKRSPSHKTSHRRKRRK